MFDFSENENLNFIFKSNSTSNLNKKKEISEKIEIIDFNTIYIDDDSEDFIEFSNFEDENAKINIFEEIRQVKKKEEEEEEEEILLSRSQPKSKITYSSDSINFFSLKTINSFQLISILQNLFML